MGRERRSILPMESYIQHSTLGLQNHLGVALDPLVELVVGVRRRMLQLGLARAVAPAARGQHRGHARIGAAGINGDRGPEAGAGDADANVARTKLAGLMADLKKNATDEKGR